MKPSLGQIVLYKLTTADAENANRQRQATPGSQNNSVFKGNTAHDGDVFPMLVTAIFDPADTKVQGQVFLDGNDNLWATSVKQGNDLGQYQFMPDPAAPQPGENVPDTAAADDNKQLVNEGGDNAPGQPEPAS